MDFEIKNISHSQNIQITILSDGTPVSASLRQLDLVLKLPNDLTYKIYDLVYLCKKLQFEKK